MMNIAEPASLNDRQLRLVPFTQEHISELYLGWLNDKQHMRFSRQRLRTHTRESASAFLRSFLNSPNYFWAVETQSANRHVGTVTTYVDVCNRTADLGILMGVGSGTSRGLGTEAWGLALFHGFSTIGLRKITGGTVASNLAMIRIFEKSGMMLEGIRRKQELLDDGPANVLLYGILKEEWTSLLLERPV